MVFQIVGTEKVLFDPPTEIFVAVPSAIRKLKLDSSPGFTFDLPYLQLEVPLQTNCDFALLRHLFEEPKHTGKGRTYKNG